MQLRAFIFIVIAASGLLNTNQAIAQIGLTTSNSHFEIGLSAGPMNFLGDLGGNRGKGTLGPKDTNIPMTNVVGGISVSYYPSQWFGLRLAGNIGSMDGDD